MQASPAEFRRHDWLWLVVITLLGLALRAYNISFPERAYFDEIYYARAARELLQNEPDPNSVHPPLGKHLIGLGMVVTDRLRAHGFALSEPFGWRLTCLVMGTACIPLVYWLAFRVGRGSTRLASMAALLVATDLLHIAESRIAMLDMPLSFFCLLGLCHCWRYAEEPGPLQALLAAATFGLATACKWSGLFAAVGGLVTVWVFCRYNGLEVDDEPAPSATKPAYWLALVFALVIPMVFLGSYFHHFQREGYSLAAVKKIRGQADRMVRFRYNEKEFTHRYKSQMYEWPLMLRPVWLLYEEKDHQVYGIVAMGSVIFWWGALLFLIEQSRRMWNEWDPRRGVAGINYLANWGFWIVSTTGGFLYYMVVAIPLMALATSQSLDEWLETKTGRISALFFGVAVLVSTAVYYPLVVGMAVPEQYFRALFALRSWV
ncbi:MAG: phospholipid carrier-dependent glycosyltransferase [Candidatus Eremiobacteraeota bacterium]|nr:phospholipid carrier-dependent glycosyltransferase [Candidatus Eremiobacteraeota bacterium]